MIILCTRFCSVLLGKFSGPQTHAAEVPLDNNIKQSQFSSLIYLSLFKAFHLILTSTAVKVKNRERKGEKKRGEVNTFKL